MGAPRFLVQNYFNDRQFTAHVLTASENSGDAWKVGALRRAAAHYWIAATAAAQQWLRSDCGAAKPADMMVVDRVSNLAGVANVKLQKSNDNFAVNVVDVVTFTIPTATSADNTALSAGVRTPEGAYLRSFTLTSERYWRLLIPVIAGARAYVGGLYVGPSWTPPLPSMPLGEDDQVPMAETTETPWGWRGSTLKVPQRQGEVLIKLRDEASYLVADDHIRDHYVKRPMWFVVDDAKAERAFLGEWPVGVTAGFRQEGGGYRPRQMRIPYVEYEPLVA